MTTIISGSSPSITFSDSTTQTTAFTSTPSVTSITTSADASIHGLTVGLGAGAVSTNTAVGASAGATNGSGAYNTNIGNTAGYSNSTGQFNVTLGFSAGYFNTGSNNTYLGTQAGPNATASSSGSNNTAVGYQAGYSNTTGINSTFVGDQAGYSQTTYGANTCFGHTAGYSANNTSAYGFNSFIGYGAGYYVTTGVKNTILGAYNGNQGGLDIRTASNNIVLSDGDGNPRQYTNGSTNVINGYISAGSLTGASAANLIPFSYLFPTSGVVASAIIQLVVSGTNSLDSGFAGYYTLSLVKAFSTYTVTVINSGLPQNNSGYGFTFALNASYLTVTPTKTTSLNYSATVLTGAYQN